MLPSVAFWVATFVCAVFFDSVCPEEADAAASADGRWRCAIDSGHWSVWVWWACTVPRLVPRFLRLRSYLVSMERKRVITARLADDDSAWLTLTL